MSKKEKGNGEEGRDMWREIRESIERAIMVQTKKMRARRENDEKTKEELKEYKRGVTEMEKGEGSGKRKRRRKGGRSEDRENKEERQREE